MVYGESLATMTAASQHTFQILTKRPARMRAIAQHFAVLPNVWLGTSIETADYLWRLDELRAAFLTAVVASHGIPG